MMLLPGRANGPFGIDLAASMAALSKVESLMSTYVAAPLKTINQTQQTIAKYEQEVVYPIAAINQARNSVTQFENQFSQVVIETDVFAYSAHHASISNGCPHTTRAHDSNLFCSVAHRSLRILS
jgi:hypothetical protein